MFWLKACPKCHGDLYKEIDIYGPYIACMQCSRYLTKAEEVHLMVHSARQVMQHTYRMQKERAAV